MIDVVLRRFEQPDEVREFDKGKLELVRLGGLTIGRATYEPGWKWSEHVGPSQVRPVAPSSTSAWWCRARRRRPSTTDTSSSCEPAICSTSRRSHTTVG
jgi:hypothetical protein